MAGAQFQAADQVGRSPMGEYTRVPIGEVTVLVYSWDAGDSEVRMRLDDQLTMDDTNRARLASQVQSELQKAFASTGLA